MKAANLVIFVELHAQLCFDKVLNFQVELMKVRPHDILEARLMH